MKLIREYLKSLTNKKEIKFTYKKGDRVFKDGKLFFIESTNYHLLFCKIVNLSYPEGLLVSMREVVRAEPAQLAALALANLCDIAHNSINVTH